MTRWLFLILLLLAPPSLAQTVYTKITWSEPAPVAGVTVVAYNLYCGVASQQYPTSPQTTVTVTEVIISSLNPPDGIYYCAVKSKGDNGTESIDFSSEVVFMVTSGVITDPPLVMPNAPQGIQLQ